MSVKIQPLADYVVASQEEAESKTASGLLLPDKAAEKPKIAKVLAVGKKVENVKVGERILYKSYSTTEVKVGGDEYMLIKEEDILTYKIDEMKDTLSKYADPKVEFSFEIVQDLNKVKFGVIQVFEFEEIPVICKRDGDYKIKKGAIYYRNSNRRPESANISNSSDMRELIERAALNKMKKWRQQGLTLSEEEENKRKEKEKGKFKKELGDI